MYDGVGPEVAQCPRQRVLVSNVDLALPKVGIGQAANPIQRHRRAVTIIVAHANLVAVAQELQHGMRADIAGATSHKNFQLPNSDLGRAQLRRAGHLPYLPARVQPTRTPPSI